MCLDLQFLTSGETAKSFLPFILAHLSRCLWACFTLPLAMSHRADSGTHLQVQGEETVPVGAACFPPHIHGSGIFSTRFQLNITIVVHGKSSGAPFWHVHAFLPLSWSFKLLSIKTGPGELLSTHLCFLGLFKIWNCQISKLQYRKDSVRSIHTLLVAKMIWFSQ